jgi:hypothetical protein
MVNIDVNVASETYGLFLLLEVISWHKLCIVINIVIINVIKLFLTPGLCLGSLAILYIKL